MCASESELRAATNGKSGIISTLGLAEPEVVVDQAQAVLESILLMRCQDDFKAALNAVKNILGKSGKGASFIGFFGDPHPHFHFIDDPPENQTRVPKSMRAQTPLVSTPQVRPSSGATDPADTPSPGSSGSGDSVK